MPRYRRDHRCSSRRLCFCFEQGFGWRPEYPRLQRCGVVDTDFYIMRYSTVGTRANTSHGWAPTMAKVPGSQARPNSTMNMPRRPTWRFWMHVYAADWKRYGKISLRDSEWLSTVVFRIFNANKAKYPELRYHSQKRLDVIASLKNNLAFKWYAEHCRATDVTCKALKITSKTYTTKGIAGLWGPPSSTKK